MADRYRIDNPVSEAVRAVSALTPEQLADCSVEVRFSEGEAAPWLEVYSPRDSPVPLVSIELPPGEAAANTARLLVLRLLHDLAGVCDGEEYAV